MDKSKLIETILTEVKDPQLREKLLAEAAKVPSKHDSGSAVMKELASLGIDTDAVRDYAGFHLKAGLVVGYLVSSLFLLGGGLVALSWLVSGNVLGALFPGFFAAIGLYGFISTRKLARVKKTTSRY